MNKHASKKWIIVLLNIRLIFLVKQQQSNSRPSLRFILDSLLRPNSTESSGENLPNSKAHLSEKTLEKQQDLEILSVIYEELELPLWKEIISCGHH